MPYQAQHLAEPPSREAVEALPGTTLLEFGTDWCGHCQRAQPLIAAALEVRSDVVHLKIADGPGQRLGRSFGVKLWPTLVVLHNGQEVARVVRPTDQVALMQALTAAQ